LSSLTAIFGNSEEKTQDSDKLMDLYWNRAELKKEFAGMRKEQFRLQDKIKQQEGATARLQQKLDYLEDLLIDPQLTYNVVVYYQLRGLGNLCERKLAKFAEQLKQQREQKRYEKVLADWNEQLGREADDAEALLLEKRDSIMQLEGQLQSEQRRLTSMGGLKRLFRGRSVMKVIDKLAGQIEESMAYENLLKESLAEVRNRQPPDHQGLDIPAKRTINLMILAFAQQLYIHFLQAGIVDEVKRATEKSVGAINYGTRHECEQLLNQVTESKERMGQGTEFADILQKRARMLGEIARFSEDEEAVPVASTVSTVFDIDANGLVRESDVNIAGENYWGISKIFSR